MEIKIEDYLSEDDIKDIVRTQFAHSVREKLRTESDIERFLVNLSYKYLFAAVDEKIGEDSLERVKDKVAELLEDDSHIRYAIWRKKDAWEKEESPAVTIMNQAIEDNRKIIEDKVSMYINSYDFDDAKDEIYGILCNLFEKRLFGNGNES